MAALEEGPHYMEMWPTENKQNVYLEILVDERLPFCLDLPEL